MLTSLLGLPLFPWTPAQGLRARRRQLRELPLPQPLPRHRPGAVGARVRPHPARDPGHPVGQQHRRRPPRRAPTTRWTARSRTCRDAKATGCAGALGVARLPADRDPDPRRLALGLRLGHRPRRRRSPGSSGRPRSRACSAATTSHNGNDSHWLSNPEQPLTGFERVIGDEAHAALAAHPARAGDGRASGSPAPTGSPARASRCASWPRSRSATASTRASCGATSWSPSASRTRPSPAAAGPVDVSGACPVLAAWDLRDDLDSPGAILFRRFVSQPARQLPVRPDRRLERPARGRRGDLRRPLRPRRPGQHAARPEHRQPARRHGARRRGHRPRGRRDPARRDPARVPVRRRAAASAIPIHGGPGHARASSTRSTSAGTPRPATRTSRTAPASSPRWASSDKGCPVKALTFVTYGAVREPGLAARRRLHQGLLAQALEPGAVLRARGRGARRSRSSASPRR